MILMFVNIEKKQKLNSFLWWSAGVAFTFLIALSGYFFSLLHGLDNVGLLACVIMIAVFYRHFFCIPAYFKERRSIFFSRPFAFRANIMCFHFNYCCYFTGWTGAAA